MLKCVGGGISLGAEHKQRLGITGVGLCMQYFRRETNSPNITDTTTKYQRQLGETLNVNGFSVTMKKDTYVNERMESFKTIFSVSFHN